jgi:predicted GNAT family acetyltransferase
MDLRWYEKEEIPSLYDDRRFNNAILYDADSPRPDMIAVASYDNGEITGMAGCSKDCGSMWQIGIDVLPEYRQRGVATTLVSLLTDEIFKRGKIPYYGTWCSNIASRTIAQNCGYFPAWVETYSASL